MLADPYDKLLTTVFWTCKRKPFCNSVKQVADVLIIPERKIKLLQTSYFVLLS